MQKCIESLKSEYKELLDLVNRAEKWINNNQEKDDIFDKVKIFMEKLDELWELEKNITELITGEKVQK